MSLKLLCSFQVSLIGNQMRSKCPSSSLIKGADFLTNKSSYIPASITQKVNNFNNDISCQSIWSINWNQLFPSTCSSSSAGQFNNVPSLNGKSVWIPFWSPSSSCGTRHHGHLKDSPRRSKDRKQLHWGIRLWSINWHLNNMYGYGCFQK